MSSWCGNARSRLETFYTGKPEHVVNFFLYIAEEVRELMSELGFRKFNELIGQRQYLNFKPAKDHWKSHNLDLEKLIFNVIPKNGQSVYNCETQNHGLEKVLDKKLILDCLTSIEKKTKVNLNYKIYNINRSVGAMLSGQIANNMVIKVYLKILLT